MKKVLGLLFCSLLSISLWAKVPEFKYVKVDTDKGELILKLYNETPQHRDNFVKLVKEGYYEGVLFHRVIHNFMIQGGDPDSKNASAGQPLGNGGPSYKIPAEIQDGLFHKKGAIGAARDNNPEKASSGSQFYFVQGKKFTDAGLDSLETLRMQGKKFTAAQRKAYTTIGGTPHLDFNYTVFGEITDGLSLVDTIAKVKTDALDRPEENVAMHMRLLTKREALNLERQAAGLKPKTDAITKFFDLFSSKNY